jgi:hypothetical protein
VEYQIHPEVFNAASESIVDVGFKQKSPPTVDEFKLIGHRDALSPTSQKSVPPPGQPCLRVGIIRSAEDGPEKTANNPELIRIVTSLNLRRFVGIALLPYKNAGDQKKLMSRKVEAAPRRPNGRPSLPEVSSCLMTSSTTVPRDATMSSSWVEQISFS